MRQRLTSRDGAVRRLPSSSEAPSLRARLSVTESWPVKILEYYLLIYYKKYC
jgi:hypothetical protein